MMLRHIAAFIITAATVVAVHLSSFQSELAACDAKSGRAVTRVYDLRGMHKAAVRNHALIPPAKPYYTNGCWSPRRYVDPAIPPTIAEFADEDDAT
jgi:hypothetical protein